MKRTSHTAIESSTEDFRDYLIKNEYSDNTAASYKSKLTGVLVHEFGEGAKLETIQAGISEIIRLYDRDGEKEVTDDHGTTRNAVKRYAEFLNTYREVYLKNAGIDSKQPDKDKNNAQLIQLQEQIYAVRENVFKTGTFFWAFIVGSYTAFFLMHSKDFNCDTFLRGALLCLLPFMATFFAIQWTLANKNALYQIRNIEAQMKFLNPATNPIIVYYQGEKSPCFLSKKPFHYPLENIVASCGIVITVVSFALFLVQCALFFKDKTNESKTANPKVWLTVSLFALTIFIVFELITSANDWREIFHIKKDKD